MKIIISNSSKSLGILYHGTDKEKLVNILRTGKLDLASGRLRDVEGHLSKDHLFYASFTRARDCSYFDFAEPNAIIAVDGQAISARYKITPVDYYSKIKGKVDLLDPDRRAEAEERLLSDSPQIPIIKYIKHVYFIQEGVSYSPQPMQMARVDAANITGTGMASILLVLKKNNIPYSFYPTLKDWRLRRGEFSAVIDPTSVRTQRVRRLDKEAYKETKALLHCLQGKMLAADREVLTSIIRRNKTEMLMLNVLDNTNHSQYNAQNNIAVLATKTVRLIKRMGLKSKADIKDFIVKALE